MASKKRVSEQRLEIDRNRISYGESKQLVVWRAQLSSETDIDKALQTLDCVDRLTEKVVVSVPNSWFMPDTPPEMRFPNPGWINWIGAAYYEQIGAAAAPQEQGKKTD